MWNVSGYPLLGRACHRDHKSDEVQVILHEENMYRNIQATKFLRRANSKDRKERY